MLDAIDLGALEAYAKRIRTLYSQLGASAWGLIYQADNRARYERLLRIQIDVFSDVKEARESQPPRTVLGYDAERPWNLVWKRMVQDHDWWQAEVSTPGLLLAVKAASLSSLLDGDAPISGASSSSNAINAPPRVIPQPPPAKISRVANAIDVHSVNRAGAPLCSAFNNGQCHSKTNQCPKNKKARHQCSICLQPGHNRTQCPASEPAKSSKRSGRKGKGKGKGKA